MGLFTKKWDHQDYRKRLQGIEKLKDQQILIRLASQDPILEVRLAAIKKIDDGLFLAQLCNALDESSIWHAAVPRIKSREILVSLAMATKFSGLTYPVMNELKGLQDERAFVAIMNEAATDAAAKQALDRVSNEQALCHAALRSSHMSVRLAAVAKIKTPQVINTVALTDKQHQVRQEAAKHVQDQPTLIKLALTDENAKVRAEAVGRLNDKAALLQVIMDEDSLAPSHEAGKRYLALGPEGDDDRALETILSWNLYGMPYADAVKRIKDQGALRRIYRDNLIDGARVAALSLIQDPALHESVVRDPKSPYAHFRAAFMTLPGANEEIAGLVNDFLYRNQKWQDRRESARKLRDLLQGNPDAAKLLWQRASETAAIPHQDSTHHEDNGMPHRSSDCSHDDYQRHIDTGVGEAFPPYPL